MSRYHQDRFPFPSPKRLREELRLRRPPVWLVLILVAIVVATWVPLTIVYRERVTTSALPRVHPIQDMDVQPRLNPQAASAFFADGRAMRQPVEGTVARGSLADEDHFDRGYTVVPDPVQPALRFFDDLPQRLQNDHALLQRGAVMYAAHCAACHGSSGTGDGLVHQRAVDRGYAGWVAPISLLSQQVRQREDGHLYNSIRQGIRNMPAFGSRVGTRDRWAIVTWVRHIQNQADSVPDAAADGAQE